MIFINLILVMSDIIMVERWMGFYIRKRNSIYNLGKIDDEIKFLSFIFFFSLQNKSRK